MAVVDRNYSVIGSHNSRRKILNWATKVVIYMTERTILKAHILYNKFHINGIQCLKFKLKIIRSIFAFTRNTQTLTIPTKSIRFLESIPPNDGKKILAVDV